MRFRCYTHSLGCTALILSLVVCEQGPSQDNVESKLDEAARKLIGTFQYKVELLLATCTIEHRDGKWAVSAIFKEKGRNVGAFEGTDVEYKSGALTFKQKFVIKPRPNWVDNEKMTIKIVGGQVVGYGEGKDAKLRTFEPVDAATATTGGERKPINDAKGEVKKLMGYWIGETTGDGGKNKTFLHVELVKEKWALNMNFFSSAGKQTGSAVGTDIELTDDNKLVFQLKFIKKPGASYIDGKRRLDATTQNSMILEKPQGSGWTTTATFVRAKK